MCLLFYDFEDFTIILIILIKNNDSRCTDKKDSVVN